MRDYIDGRVWADHGHQFSEQVAVLLAAAKDVFCRLQRIEYDAPWGQTNPHSC